MQEEFGAALSPSEHLKPKLFALLEQFAIERREVKLASGQSSSIYIDCRQVYFRGEAQFIIGELFFNQLRSLEINDPFNTCGGMAMGSIPLSCALSLAAFRRGRELPGFAVRKTAKDHGMMSLVEGNSVLKANDRVLMVEDVVTTASSSILAIEAVRALGCRVDTVLAIVDREQGARENLARHDVNLHALFTLKEFVGVSSCG